MYYAAITLLNPTSISVSTIASLQQSAILLRWLFWDIFYQADLIRRSVSRVQNLYDMEKNIQVMKDGDLPYPSEKQSVKGMGFELRYVLYAFILAMESNRGILGTFSSHTQEAKKM